MKKLISAVLTSAFIAGFSVASHAVPVKDMNVDISGLGQFLYQWSEATNNDDLDTRRLRIQIAAQPAEHVSFYTAIDGTNNTGGDSRLVDMYADISYLDWVTLRVGQFALPNSYELNTPEYELETINYSQGVGTYSMRDRGFMLSGAPIKEFSWALTGTNGIGAGAIDGATDDNDDKALYMLQLNWIPLENLSFKLWGAMEDDNPAAGDTDALGVGFNYTYEGFHLFGEYNTANNTAVGALADKNVDEYYVQVSYKIPETNVQLVARYDDMEDETVVPTADTQILTAGINYDFEKNARLQLQREFVDGSDNDITQLQLSVRF